MMTGLDELVLECASEGRSHILEAVRCYNAGAYRSAIITTYVAVSFDLIKKMRFLADAGDGHARRQIDHFDGLQAKYSQNDPIALPGLLEFERDLAENFRDNYDFFGGSEFEDIARLRKDRNRCAHPTFLSSAEQYAPSAELARLHIVNAINLVLAQNARQGKAALKSLSDVITSIHFPSNRSDALERLRGSELQHARPHPVKTFVDALAFGWPDPNSPYFLRSSTIHALLAAIDIHKTAAIARAINAMEKHLAATGDNQVHFGVIIAAEIIDAGEAASESSKAVIRHWLDNANVADIAELKNKISSLSWWS